jgi:hypothetical protein
MPPKRSAQVDQLSEAEEALHGFAVRLDSALRYRTHAPESVDDQWYIQSIGDDLVRAGYFDVSDIANWLFQKRINDIYNESEVEPRIHPIIAVIGEEWSRATQENRQLDIDAISRAEITSQCRAGAAAHPQWNGKLNMLNLPVLRKLQPDEECWWLPPLSEEVEATQGMSLYYTLPLALPFGL